MLAVFLVAYFFLPDIVGRFGSEFQTDGAIKLGKWANWPEVVFLPKSVIFSNRNKMIPLPCPPPHPPPPPPINLFVTGWLVIQQSRVSPVGVCAFERHILETNGAEVVVLAVVDEGGGRVLESLFQLAQGILRRQPWRLVLPLRLVHVEAATFHLEMVVQLSKPPENGTHVSFRTAWIQTWQEVDWWIVNPWNNFKTSCVTCTTTSKSRRVKNNKEKETDIRDSLHGFHKLINRHVNHINFIMECVCVCVCGGGGGIITKEQTEMDEQNSQTHRNKDKVTDWDREKARDRDRQTERDRGRLKQTETEGGWNRQRQREAETDRDRGRLKQTEGGWNRQRQREAETDRDRGRLKQTEGGWNRQRQREAKRDRDRGKLKQAETEGGWDRKRQREAETDTDRGRLKQTEGS